MSGNIKTLVLVGGQSMSSRSSVGGGLAKRMSGFAIDQSDNQVYSRDGSRTNTALTAQHDGVSERLDYGRLMGTAFDRLRQSRVIVVIAPFWTEFGNGVWVQSADTIARSIGASMIRVWVDSDAEPHDDLENYHTHRTPACDGNLVRPRADAYFYAETEGAPNPRHLDRLCAEVSDLSLSRRSSAAISDAKTSQQCYR